GGALYSLVLGGSFGQHYWTRVWMGPDGWIPIDTTTGEVGRLSPIHLTFWNLGGIGSLSVKVLDFAPKPKEEAAPPTGERKPITMKAGEKERYIFKMDSKTIGEQTAECVKTESRVGKKVSDWKWAIRLTLEAQGQPIKLNMDGTFTVTDTVAP